MRHRDIARQVVIAASIALVGAWPVSAQTLRSVQVRADNDYFNLWDGFWDRPDRDYTHGTKLSLSFGSNERPARSFGVELGQLIFNPTNSFLSDANRPYAGWLYVTGIAYRLDDRRRVAVGGYVGTTGDASLAEETQRRFHEWAGRQNNPPWEPVVEDEVGVGLVGRIGWWAPPAEVGPAALGIGVDLLGDVGTVRVEAGIAPNVEANIRFGRFELRARAASLLRLRAHDSFVEGSLFSGRSFVDLEPVLREGALEVGVRWGSFTIQYHVAAKGREFSSQRHSHTYSGLAIGYGVAAETWLPTYFRSWRP